MSEIKAERRRAAGPTETTEAECLRCGLIGDREMVIGATEQEGKRAIDQCSRCGSLDARWM